MQEGEFHGQAVLNGLLAHFGVLKADGGFRGLRGGALIAYLNARLIGIQSVIAPFQCEQRIMRAALYDFARFDYKDLICSLDRAQSVCDYKRRSATHE